MYFDLKIDIQLIMLTNRDEFLLAFSVRDARAIVGSIVGGFEICQKDPPLFNVFICSSGRVCVCTERQTSASS